MKELFDNLLSNPIALIAVGIGVFVLLGGTKIISPILEKLKEFLTNLVTPKIPVDPVVPVVPIDPEKSKNVAAVEHYMALSKYCSDHPEAEAPLKELWKCLDPNHTH